MLRFTALVKPLVVVLALTAAFVLSSDDRGLGQEEPELAPNTLSAARFNTCVVTHTRAAECWGSNAAGALGVGSTVDVGFETTRPIPVMRLKHGVVAVSSGSQNGEESHSCVVLTGGRVQCWGANCCGELNVP